MRAFFFVLRTTSLATIQSLVRRMRANLGRKSEIAQILSNASMASSIFSVRFSRDDFWRMVGRGLAVCAVFGLSANVHAQTSWIGDVLIQRLPDGQAYAEVQTAWTSTAETASDSLTLKATTSCRFKKTRSWRARTSKILLHCVTCMWRVWRCLMEGFAWSGLWPRMTHLFGNIMQACMFPWAACQNSPM